MSRTCSIATLYCIISALHGLPARTRDEKGVCPSVCVSVKRVDCDKMEERSVQIFIPYERSFSLCANCQWQSCKAFIGLTNRAKMIVVGGDPLYLKFWINRRFSISFCS